MQSMFVIFLEGILYSFIHLICFWSIQILAVLQDNGLYPEGKEKK